MNRFEEAVSHYRAVVDDPGSGGIDPWIRALARYRIGMCQGKSGDVAGAVKTFRAFAEALITTKRTEGTFPGLDLDARRFFLGKVFEDLGRLWPDREADWRTEPWVLGGRQEENIEILAMVRSWILPAIKRVGEGAGRIRVPAEFEGEFVLPVLVRRDGIWLGGFIRTGTLRSNLGIEKRHPHSPLGLELRMPGGTDEAPRTLASRPLFPGLESVVLAVHLRDAGAPARETGRRRASLLFLLALAGVVLFTGTVLVLRRLKKEMDLSRLKSDFFANVSHDLRTPLAIIRSSAETLRLGRVQDEEKKRKYMDVIIEETDRIDALVGNVLEASRIELGRKTYSFGALSPEALVSEVEDARRLYLEEQGFAFEVFAEEGLPEIRADVEALRSALYNLIENAVKYSADRKEISLRALRRGGELVLTVEDRGPGIPEGERERIFERFYRRGGLPGAGTGVGLGLSLVLETVRAHGGRIEVEAREGGGASFRVLLPVALRSRKGCEGPS
jgi:signal transduction histidine kinase